MTFEKTYTQEEFRNILTSFQNGIKQNKYNERIPYDIWRAFNKADKVQVWLKGCLTLKVAALNPDGSWFEFQEYEISYSNRGFGSFFFENYIENANNDEKKENNTMKMPNMNFDFGPFTGKEVAVSPYGIAVRNKDGEYLAYNAATGATVDVTGFTFDFQKMIYKMPAAIKDLRAGDMVLHRGKPMYVQSVEEDGIHCIDILNSENKVIVPVTNMFGFNFVTKVVSLMNFNAAQPSAENPFGNLMPFMMMSSVMDDDSDNDFSKMMMMSMMMGGSNPFTTMFTPQDK